jgi:hypothetical protein
VLPWYTNPKFYFLMNLLQELIPFPEKSFGIC